MCNIAAICNRLLKLIPLLISLLNVQSTLEYWIQVHKRSSEKIVERDIVLMEMLLLMVQNFHNINYFFIFYKKRAKLKLEK